jgi:KDO2-lipid IV(A) lauroyltransferase
MGARYSITSLYLKPRVRELEDVYRQARERSGARLHRADTLGMRAVYQTLRGGGVVGLLPDQDPGPYQGVFVPFFGIPANSSDLLPRIASRLRSTVLLAFAERLPRAAGYRIHIQPGSEEITGNDIMAGARALSRDVESLVRLAPLQYLWSYKRFHTRPPGCPDLYRGTARPERS